MESVRNLFRQNSVSSPKILPNALLYSFAYFLFLFLLTLCLDKDSTLNGQLDSNLPPNSKACLDFSQTGQCSVAFTQYDDLY